MLLQKPALRHILIVEDHIDSAKVLARLIKLDGHFVSVEHTLAGAKEACAATSFDLILCDIHLPDGDGIEIAPVVKQSCPNAKLIALTGISVPETVDSLLASGFDACFIKPIPFDSLRQYLV